MVITIMSMSIVIHTYLSGTVEYDAFTTIGLRPTSDIPFPALTISLNPTADPMALTKQSGNTVGTMDLPQEG